MDAILAKIEKSIQLSASSPHIAAALDGTVVPGSGGKTLAGGLNKCVQNRTVDASLITALAELVHCVACQLPAKSKKRKRDSPEDENGSTGPSPSTSSDVHFAASQLMAPAFQAAHFPPPPPQMTFIEQGIPLDHNTIASIRGPLHHVFLFCATSAVGLATRNVEMLQEISGLVQILGILHDVVIISANMADPLARSQQTISDSGTPLPVRQLQSIQANFPDIAAKTRGAALFRPAFQVPSVPCGFRAQAVYERDALRRHEANVKSSEAWAQVAMEEVQADSPDIQSSTRRAKSAVPSDTMDVDELEEGEPPKDAVAVAQDRATVVHALLRRHVTEKLSAGGKATRTGGSPPGGLSLSAMSARGFVTAALLPGVSSSAAPPKSSLLVGYNLSEEKTALLERAITAASWAARMQAELEAQLELENEDEQCAGGG
ncbi:hypothetical protein M407DRAFT_33614 [Tulasnella calospora MUT 4182]|uniref:Uncharacterized protein n=1 Tax=Tulasnella calospora MUT 4182 TaxID=1051891 RepID=A0A0C3Q2Q2_9AGAM|nr:hypothetical protein M407DRAFT_33614 [Tulasnella calospora MUT 4182]